MALVYELPYGSQEVAERLRRVTGPLTGAEYGTPLLGEILPDGFRVKANTVSRRGLRLQSSYSPIALGRMVDHAGGCRVEVRLGPSAWTLLFMSGWIRVGGSMGARQFPDVRCWEAVVSSITASE